MNDFLNFVKNFIALIIVLCLLFFFVVGIEMAPNDDMSPRVSAGDVVLYYKLSNVINSQDVVVLKKNDTEYIGRVIGLPGDTVEVTEDSNLIVNGNMVIESNIFYVTPPYEGFLEYPLTLGSDEYFILVDKREHGEDSRYYGPVKRSEIKGVVIGQFRRNNI